MESLEDVNRHEDSEIQLMAGVAGLKEDLRLFQHCMAFGLALRQLKPAMQLEVLRSQVAPSPFTPPSLPPDAVAALQQQPACALLPGKNACLSAVTRQTSVKALRRPPPPSPPPPFPAARADLTHAPAGACAPASASACVQTRETAC